MPSERFFNLPEDKKKRIIEASLKEFARVPFDDISINRIIQDADISRGSFYQYFVDKTDLQMYLLSDFSKQMQDGIDKYLNDKHGDLFTFFEDGLKFLVDLVLQTPYRDVCKNVFAQMAQCNGCKKDTPFSREGKEIFDKIMTAMKTEYYQDYKDEDLVLVWEMLMILVKESLLKVFLLEEPKEEILDCYHKKAEIIKVGFKSKENKNA